MVGEISDLPLKFVDFYGAIILDNVPSRPAHGLDFIRILGDEKLLFEEENPDELFYLGEFQLDITGVEVLITELGFDCNMRVMDFPRQDPF